MLRPESLSPTLILPFLLLLLSGCSTTEPDVPDDKKKGSESVIAGDISMAQLTDLPVAGGEAADVAIAPDGSVVAILDGRLVRVPSSGGVASTIDDSREYRRVVVTSTGTIIADSEIGLEVFEGGVGGPRTASVVTTGATVEGTNLVLTATGVPYMLVYDQSGTMSAHYSNDDGKNWKRLSLPDDLRYGGGIAINPAGRLFVAGSGGLYETSNMGLTWTTRPAPVPGQRPELLATKFGILVAWIRGKGGLWRSIDNGKSFLQVRPLNSYPVIQDVGIGEFGELYAALGVGGTEPDSVAQIAFSIDGEVWHTYVIAQGTSIDIRDPYLAVGLAERESRGERVGPGGVLHLTSGNSFWTFGGLGRVEELQDVAFDDNGALLLLADHALYRRGGSRWEFLAGSSEVTHVAAAGSEICLAGARALHSNDYGENWSRVVPAENLFPSGDQYVAASDLIPRKGGGFYYSRGLRSAGTTGDFGSVLYAISSEGEVTPLTPPPGGNFGPMSQSLNDILHAGRTIGGQTEEYRSSDWAKTWMKFEKGSERPFPYVFNSSNRGISVNLTDLELSVTPIDATTSTIYRLLNLPAGLPRLRELVLDAQGRAWVVVEGEGVWWSSETLE